MTEKDTGSTEKLTEEDIIALLATLKQEPTPEANFEERFLCDFHDMVAREVVCTPARHRVWQHLLQLFTGMGRRKLAFGASTLSVGALALGVFAIPGADDEAATLPKSSIQPGFSIFSPSSASRSTRPYTSVQTIKAKQNSIYHANPTSWVEESPALPADSPVKLSSDPDLYTSAATNDEDNFCKINYAFSH
ncbi:MAG: hypothetical protein ACI4OX_00635 [Akkermansia sp.]